MIYGTLATARLAEIQSRIRSGCMYVNDVSGWRCWYRLYPRATTVKTSEPFFSLSTNEASSSSSKATLPLLGTSQSSSGAACFQATRGGGCAPTRQRVQCDEVGHAWS